MVVTAGTVAGAAELAAELDAGADVAGAAEGRVMVTLALRQNAWANWRVAFQVEEATLVPSSRSRRESKGFYGTYPPDQ